MTPFNVLSELSNILVPIVSFLAIIAWTVTWGHHMCDEVEKRDAWFRRGVILSVLTAIGGVLLAYNRYIELTAGGS